MAKGTINKVILIGRLGTDPDERETNGGVTVAKLSLATNDGYKDKGSGEFIDQTNWHLVTVFGNMASAICQYAKKGTSLYIEGRIQTDKWQDKEGNDRYTTKIIADGFQFIGGNNNSRQSQSNSSIDDDDELPF